MNDALTPPLVQTPDALQTVIESLSSVSTIAIDTEFHAERRYQPDLMLLQVGSPNGPVFTLDPLAVDLRPLGAVLDQKVWVAHAAHWDLVLVHGATGARPRALLDTQVLAGLAGIPFPARLNHLTQLLLGQTLSKGATLSDWSRRPLVPAQLEYARDDVRLLCPLVDVLQSKIASLDDANAERRGRAWSLAAGQEAIEMAFQEPDPDTYWRNLDIAPDFDLPTRRVLRALYTWREGEAKRRNTPVHYVLAPSIALDLARRRPKTEQDLKANRRIPGGLVKRYRGDLLRVIREAKVQPPPPRSVDLRNSGRGPLIAAWSVWMANRLSIAPNLLAPRETIAEWAAHGPSALRGWRAEALSGAMHDLFEGHTRLYIGDKGVLNADFVDTHP